MRIWRRAVAGRHLALRCSMLVQDSLGSALVSHDAFVQGWATAAWASVGREPHLPPVLGQTWSALWPKDKILGA